MAVSREGDDVSKFFIFDTRLGQREENEHEKILFYYPASATLDQQQSDVGLCEALINFTRTFSPDKPCRALHTDQMRQVLWEPEPCVWMVLVAKRAKVPNRDSDSYGEDDLSSQVMDAIVRNAYLMLSLFHGSIKHIVSAVGADGLRRKLSLLMPSYISTLPQMSKLDLTFSLRGIRYFPVDRHTFLALQSFFHLVQQDFGHQSVRYGMCLYQDMLVWTSLPDAADINALYSYLVLHVVDDSPTTAPRRPRHVPAKDPDAPAIFHPYNRVWILPLNLSSYSTQQVASVCSKIPRVYLSEGGRRAGAAGSANCAGNGGGGGGGGGGGEGAGEGGTGAEATSGLCACHLVLFRNGQALWGFLVHESEPLANGALLAQLAAFVDAHIRGFDKTLASLETRTQLQEDEPYRYLYFNHMNLAVKDSLRTGGKAAQQALNPQTQALLLEMHAALTGEGQDTPPNKPLPSSAPPIPPTESQASHAHHAGDGEEGGEGAGRMRGSNSKASAGASGALSSADMDVLLLRPKEVCVKTSADGWVVGRISNGRELYVISDNKASNLAEVNDEVERITSNYFSNIFM